MKKLFMITLLFGALVLNYELIQKAPDFIEKQVQSISGMNKKEFDNFINKKHYLVKSWALDSTDVDPEILRRMNETFNYQVTAYNYIQDKINELSK